MAKWTISRAVADELDAALSLAFCEPFRAVVPSYSTAVEGMPPDQYAQGHDLFEGLAGEFFSVLSRLATPLGLTGEEDYSKLSLRLREVSADDVEEAVRAQADDLGVEADWESPTEALQRYVAALRRGTRMRFAPDGEAERLHARECEVALSIVAGGPMQGQFWHWLDRFYYETYQPWRREREGFMESEMQRATAALGGADGEGVPDIDWLADENPLSRLSLLRNVALSGDFDLIFWVEPFGLWDMVGLLPRGLLVSFASPGVAFDAFREQAESISERLKVLSDPTRLTMLRIVRQLEVDNSEIADYLGVSHPTVSVHAKLLREAGLIKSRRVGRRLFHSIDPVAIRRLLRELESFLGVIRE